MIDRPRVLDVPLGDLEGLIGKSLQPQDTRQGHARHHLLVILKADGVRSANRGDIAAEHALEVPPRVRLVAQVVQRGADHPLADGPIGRIRHPVAEALRQLERGAALAAADAELPQAPERPQLILRVGEAVGDLEGGGPGCDGVGRRPRRLRQRHPERGAEPHLTARVATRAGPEPGERALDAAATLDHARLLEPERHRRGGERHPDRRVATRRERPVQRRSQVVDLPAVGGQPVDGGARLQFGLGSLEEVPEVFGVASGHRVELAVFGEFLERVSPRRLE